MKRRYAILLLPILAAAACTEAIPTSPDLPSDLPISADPANTATVTHNGDAGPGSFRAAVALANADPAVRTIRFADGVGTVALLSTVMFTGAQDLAIDGRGAIIDGAGAGADAFAATGGGSLSLEDVTIQNAPEDGVFVDVPGSAMGRGGPVVTRAEAPAGGAGVAGCQVEGDGAGCRVVGLCMAGRAGGRAAGRVAVLRRRLGVRAGGYGSRRG